MTPEAALEWVDDTLEELGRALAACIESNADPLIVSAKINTFVMTLMQQAPPEAA